IWIARVGSTLEIGLHTGSSIRAVHFARTVSVTSQAFRGREHVLSLVCSAVSVAFSVILFTNFVGFLPIYLSFLVSIDSLVQLVLDHVELISMLLVERQAQRVEPYERIWRVEKGIDRSI